LRPVKELAWSNDPGTEKLIFVVGNGPFTMAPATYPYVPVRPSNLSIPPADYREAVVEVKKKNIAVNTVYLGSEPDPYVQAWQDAAALGGGSFSQIPMNYTEYMRAPAPQNARLAALNGLLSSTYVPFGPQGAVGAKNQALEDWYVSPRFPDFREMMMPAERAIMKASSAYNNSHWDLVDAAARGRLSLATLPADELPPQMRGLDRVAYVAAMAEERQALQVEIRKLAAEREEFLASHGQNGEVKTLSSAVIQAIRSRNTGEVANRASP
jgi:hypothetical protein